MELKISLALPDEALLPELAAALEKRVELASRARLPRFWPIIDWLHAHSKGTPRQIRFRRIYRGILAAVLWILSLVLLLPAFFAPQELGSFIPLGLICALLAEAVLLYIIPKIMGAANLVLGGIILFGAGSAPETLGRLMPLGIFLLCFAILGFFPRGRRKRRFEKQAAELYRQWSTVEHLGDYSVTVSETGMALTKGDETQPISPEAITEIYETPSLLLPVVDNRMLLLQKNNIAQEDLEQLASLLGKTIISVKEEERS